MTFPLIFLALASVFAGFIPFNELVTSDGKPFETELELIVAIPSVLIGLLGIGIAYVNVQKGNRYSRQELLVRFKYGYKWAYNKFYIDEVIPVCYKKDNLQIHLCSHCLVRQAYC